MSKAEGQGSKAPAPLRRAEELRKGNRAQPHRNKKKYRRKEKHGTPIFE